MIIYWILSGWMDRWIDSSNAATHGYMQYSQSTLCTPQKNLTVSMHDHSWTGWNPHQIKQYFFGICFYCIQIHRCMAGTNPEYINQLEGSDCDMSRKSWTIIWVLAMGQTPVPWWRCHHIMVHSPDVPTLIRTSFLGEVSVVIFTFCCRLSQNCSIGFYISPVHPLVNLGIPRRTICSKHMETIIRYY